MLIKTDLNKEFSGRELHCFQFFEKKTLWERTLRLRGCGFIVNAEK